MDLTKLHNMFPAINEVDIMKKIPISYDINIHRKPLIQTPKKYIDSLKKCRHEYSSDGIGEKEATIKPLGKQITILDDDDDNDENKEKLIETSLSQKKPLHFDHNNYPKYVYYNKNEFIRFITNYFDQIKTTFETRNKKSSEITCADLKKNQNDFTLMLHQELVKDYLNLFSPYRGLLLYHGLGSGKTCTSIAIAEGMKNEKQIIVMLPASLRTNYLNQLKQCGDPIFRIKQHWKKIPYEKIPEKFLQQTNIFGVSQQLISTNRGLWITKHDKSSNYEQLNNEYKKQIDNQINEMIQEKYIFINYNASNLGPTKKNPKGKYNELLEKYGQNSNLFENKVLIIDEVHNFLSRIVNKINAKKTSIYNKIYKDILLAKNCRIVFLTGTPLINYTNELAVLFNMLRGIIDVLTLTFYSNNQIKLPRSGTLPQELDNKFNKYIDLIDYQYDSNTKIYTITVSLNPYGFKTFEDNKLERIINPQITLETVKTALTTYLKNTFNIENITTEIKQNMALPDDLDIFNQKFVDQNNLAIKNKEMFQKRIIGLTSYFRSPQEKLLPRFDPSLNIHIVKLDMTIEQLGKYNAAREIEKKLENNQFQNKKNIATKGNDNDIKSNYRVLSRQFCNFGSPDVNGKTRPLSLYLAKEKANKNNNLDGGANSEDDLFGDNDEDEYEENKHKFQNNNKNSKNNVDPFSTDEEKEDDEEEEEEDDEEEEEEEEDEDEEEEEEEEEDEDEENEEPNVLNDKQRFEKAKEELVAAYKLPENKQRIFQTELKKYSPKYYKIIDSIEKGMKDPSEATEEERKEINMYKGLHLVYSQFRNLEGIELFSLALEANGFQKFPLSKTGNKLTAKIKGENKIEKNTKWYGLFTGKESTKYKENMRLIFNGELDKLKGKKLKKQITSLFQYQNGQATYNRYEKENKNLNIDGNLMKVFMITSSGSEGINLFNTRCVHIMEPYWNPVRIEQTIGRARRICSHQELPEGEREVNVFIYIMKFPKTINIKMYASLDSEKETSDEILWEIASMKKKLSEGFLTAVKESSIDCTIYKNPNMNCFLLPKNAIPGNYLYQVDFNKEKEDQDEKINVKTQKLNISQFKIKDTDYYYVRPKPNEISLEKQYDVYKEETLQTVAGFIIYKKQDDGTIKTKFFENKENKQK
jgi:hypothetical protein